MSRSSWSVFSSADLERYIGKKTLNNLNYYLPLLKNDEFNPSDIYKRSNLAKIFDSFYGVDHLEKKSFRGEFFSSLSDEKLTEISYAIFEESIFDRKKVITKLLKIKWIKSEQVEKLFELLNLNNSLIPEKKIPPNQLTNSFFPLKSFKQLKSYQFPVYFKSMEQLKESGSRFIIKMPTGSGKTRVAMEVISDYINSSNENVNIVWLAHQKELCEQAYECFVDVWSHLSKKKLNLHRMWDENDTTKFPNQLEDNNFFIGNFQKIYSNLETEKNNINSLKDKVSLIVVDEAHRVLAPTYKKAVNYFSNFKTKIIGLTATPGRSYKNEEENKKLAKFFRDNFVEIIISKGKRVISYLRSINVLSTVKYEPIHIEETISLSAKQKEYIASFDKLPFDIIEQLSNSQIRNYEILKRMKNILDENPKSKVLFFGLSIDHSKFICAMLNIMGINAKHVDGSTSSTRRSASLLDFKEGNLSVLCNERLMSTGFDAPKTDNIVIAKPTSSIVLYSQIIGRGLRGPEIGGTKYCKVIDVKDNILGFSDHDKVYEFFDEYFDSA